LAINKNCPAMGVFLIENKRCSSVFFYLLKIREIKKKRVEKRIIKGPAGRWVTLKSKLPKRQLKMPRTTLPK